MANAAALGITDVMFQVRGQADAYYWNNNGIEVRASGVTQSNDPLSLGKQIPLQPEHVASLGFDYTFTAGALSGFGFGVSTAAFRSAIRRTLSDPKWRTSRSG